MALAFIGCESNKIIVYGLEEKDANEILVFLASKNIEAQKVPAIKESGGASKAQLFDVAVSSSRAAEAMAALNSVGLPRRRSQSLLSLFSAGGLVPSEMQDKIRYQAGLAEQISNTIRKIDGVLDADVQLSFPEENPLNPKAEKGKVVASVYVKHNGVLDDPNSHLDTKLKRLVASSVQGLSYDDVTIIGDRARFSTEANVAQAQRTQKERIDYVKVWGVIVAKNSLSRFQLFFFTFSLIILILLLLLAWLIWKIFPVAKEQGGIASLFRLSSLEHKKEETEEEETEKEGEKEVKEEEKKAETPAPAEEKKKPKPKPPAGPKVQENVET